MASNPLWRGTPEDWRRRVGEWIARGRGESLLNVDIFFDFAPVLGDTGLAAALRRDAIAAAGKETVFRKLRERKLISAGDAVAVAEALEAFMGAILRQQLADGVAGIAPSSKIDPSILDRRERRTLRAHLAMVDIIQPMVEGAVSW